MNENLMRLLDANFNRAREALRVMEDYARFILDDARLSRIAKQMRHELAAAVPPDERLCASRDTPGDVGTTIATEAEYQRPDAAAVLTAACKRLPEALRCLEEYAKTIDPDLARKTEQLRYRAYELEKQLSRRLHTPELFREVRLYVLLTETLCRLPLMDTVHALIDGGVDAIQLREKDRPDGKLLELASEIGQICREHDVRLIINDRPDIAALSAAAGVHLGQDDLPVAQARKILPAGSVVGKSTHSIAEARSAAAEQPDYLAVGAIFSSPTKPDVAVAGPGLIPAVRAFYAGTLLAIGGITAETAPQALAAGATGVAVCQAVIAADNPAAAAEKISAAME